MAEVSSTPLVRKLGIKSGCRFALAGAVPPGFVRALEPLPDCVILDSSGEGEPCDVVLVFAADVASLREGLAAWRVRLSPAGGLWLCWPKKASGVATDLSDAVVREMGLAAGLVDNKVCSIDATWSALRFVVRVADRKVEG